MPTLAAIREALVHELKTTNLPQAKSMLQSCEGYCCLGIFCLVAERHGIKVHKDADGRLIGNTLHSQPEVLKWTGLDSFQGIFKAEKGKPMGLKESELDDDTLALAELNDSGRYTFKELAEIIELNANKLFIEEPNK